MPESLSGLFFITLIGVRLPFALTLYVDKQLTVRYSAFVGKHSSPLGFSAKRPEGQV
jgi:hypothetical protein